MAGAKGIVLALAALGKAAKAAVLTQGWELLSSAGDNFVDVGLVAHIKHNFILGRRENAVQC